MKLQISFRGEPRGTVISDEAGKLTIEGDQKAISDLLEFYGDDGVGKYVGDDLLKRMAWRMKGQWFATIIDPPAPANG